jgi:hypothetical protein
MVLKREVFGPLIAPGIEQRNQRAALRIDTAQVRALGEIAPRTAQREVLRFIGATVLFRDDVFDVQGKVAVLLAKKAILASLFGSYLHEAPRCGIHQGLPFTSRIPLAFALTMAIKSAAST